MKIDLRDHYQNKSNRTLDTHTTTLHLKHPAQESRYYNLYIYVYTHLHIKLLKRCTFFEKHLVFFTFFFRMLLLEVFFSLSLRSFLVCIIFLARTNNIFTQLLTHI